MSTQWTEKQEEAINYHDGSAIVSAAAGSGKTAVLVERVIRLLTDEKKGVDADKLVVATFTEKAAGELQTRLQKAISEAIAQNPDNAYLRSQRTKLEDASISTISSFCMKLIRENSAFLGLAPDFSVIDTAEGRLVYQKALDYVMEKFYEGADKKKKALLYDWYGGENDKGLCQAVTAVYELMRKLPDPEASVKKWQDMYDNPAKYKKDLFALYAEICIKPVAEEMAELLPQEDDVWTDERKPCLEPWRQLIGNLLGASGVKKKFFAVKSPSVKNALAVQLVSPKKATKNYDNTIEKAANKALLKIWEKLVPVLTATLNYTQNMKECAPVFRELTALAVQVGEEYSARKRAKNKIDFSDAEYFALKLLSDEDAAKEIRKSAQVIIVDEFQDSNDIQYEIFRRLSDNCKNLFFVGDIKQSIYRFRGANPGVFARIMKDDNFHPIHLNCNFRSSATIIDSVNSLFEKTMTEKVGEVEYDDDARLVLGAKQYKPNPGDKTELIRIKGGNMPDAREKEAGYIAYRIRKMVESGYEVTEKDGTKRPCGYGDFAVLMGRYSKTVHIYKKELTKAGIPIDAKDDGTYTDNYEIKQMLALLRIIDNPYYNCELMSLLTLPPYCMSPDEMAQVKLLCTSSSLYTGLRRFAEENPTAERFCAELDRFREFAAEHSVEQLIRFIYDESELVSAIQASYDGDKRDSNLKLLISHARRFSENGIRGLYDFLRYMDMVSSGGISLEQASSAEYADGAVKLMTIHSSKGLEYPIVFVSNLSSSVKNPEHGKINTDIEYGVGMRVIRRSQHILLDSFMFNLITRIGEMQKMSEEMRLLYVAATRAKEKLIFTAPVAGGQKHKVHLKWVEESIGVAKGIIEVTDNPEYEEKGEKTEEKSDKALVIRPYTDYKYSKYTTIPAKVTATQIGVKSVDDFSDTVTGADRFLKMPTFTKGESKRKLSGKKKGDAYHKAMELIDFKGGISQLDKLHDRSKLTDEEYDCIDKEEVISFLESDLCARINRSSEMHKEFPIFFEYCPEDIPEDEEKQFVQGIADLYFVEDGKIVLVDYKTNAKIKSATNTKTDEEATTEKLIEEYKGQLEIYAQALEKMTCMPVKECYLWAFTIKKAIKVEI